MGKKRKKNVQNRQGNPNTANRKRQRRERYWIEDCPEKSVANEALTVLITRAELSDDHPTSKHEPGPEGKPTVSAVFEFPDVKRENEAGSKEKVDLSSITNLETVIGVKRGDSATAKPKKFARKNYQPLPDGDCGDGIKNPFPKTQVADKYWAQRHRFFSRFDEGIQLDDESWYSVTPEAIASHHAERVIQCSKMKKTDLVVLDAFCGAGGNAIAFAQRPEVSLVVCVDIDQSKLLLAARNAEIYSIPKNKLLFIRGDACDVLDSYKDGALVEKGKSLTTNNADAVDIHGYMVGGADMLPKNIDSVFLSPPWGGVDYANIGPRSFNLKCIKLQNGADGETSMELAVRAITKDCGALVMFLPRNTNGLEIGKSALNAGVTGLLELEQNVVNDKFKGITTYMSGLR